MYITLRKGTHNSKPFLVRIYVNDQGPNRLLEVERAELRCTCDIYLENDMCRHVKECQTELQQWQTRQLRKLRRESTGNATIEKLCARLAEKLPRDLHSAEIIPLPDGTFALQWETSSAERYADGCGWGTGGRHAELITDWPDIAILHLLQKEPDFLVWHWEIEEMLLYPHAVTVLPPRVSAPGWRRGEDPPMSGQGLFDLLDAEKESVDIQAANTRAWARFWTATCGLHLEDDDWRGKGRYLPGWHLGQERVAALALDLKYLKAKGLTAESLSLVRQGVPGIFRNRYGHVHRAWAEEQEDSLGYQVVVCNANDQPLKPYDNLVMLTTNVWADDREMQGPTEALFHQVAEILLRMGHDPGCSLYHGSARAAINPLAGLSRISEQSPAWDIPAEGWRTLQEEILPVVAADQPFDSGSFLDVHEGQHWAQVVPPC